MLSACRFRSAGHSTFKFCVPNQASKCIVRRTDKSVDIYKIRGQLFATAKFSYEATEFRNWKLVMTIAMKVRAIQR